MSKDLKFGSSNLMVFNIENLGPVIGAAVASLIVAFRASQKTLEAVKQSDVRHYPHVLKVSQERVEDLYAALYYVCKVFGMESPVKDLYDEELVSGRAPRSPPFKIQT